MDNASHNPVSIFPQFLNPNPQVISNLQLRRAMLHAVDRQELADTLMARLTPVAHSFLFPNQAQCREIEAALPRYGHDPRRAGQMVEALGQGSTQTSKDIVRDRRQEVYSSATACSERTCANAS